MKVCLRTGTRGFWVKKTAGFCQEPDDSNLQSELCPITSKQQVLWACFVLKWGIVFHFPSINMHRTTNEAEPTKIIRFWSSGTTDCINGVWLCGEAFVSWCLWTWAQNGNGEESVLGGTWIQWGFDLHSAVITLSKCSTREGLYPLRLSYSKF